MNERKKITFTGRYSNPQVFSSVYNQIISKYGNDVGKSFDAVATEQELAKGSNQTQEQIKRDRPISRLLETYVKTYMNKRHDNRIYKPVLFSTSVIAFIALVSVCVCSMIVSINKRTISITDCVALVTVCATVIGSISFLLRIIADYIFPQNEDTSITDIVKAIQSNDLSDKKLNIEAMNYLIQKNQNIETHSDENTEGQ